MTIGFSEVEPIDKRFSINSVRMGFLNSIQEDEETYRILEDLAGYPFHYFVELGLGFSIFRNLELWPIRDYHIRLYGRPLYLLRASLLEWARRWHLEADWCLKNACWTLELWRDCPHKEGERLEWGLDGVGWMRFSDEQLKHLNPPFSFRAWIPDVERRSHYEEYAQQQVNQDIIQSRYFPELGGASIVNFKKEVMDKITAYCDKVLDFYLSQKDFNGKPQWKKMESKAEIKRNVTWAVKLQVLGPPQGVTYSKIASEAGVFVSTVSRATDYVFKLIGLPKRDDLKPGPVKGRKKASDSHRRRRKPRWH